MADTGTILTRADSDAWRIACERESIIRALVAMPRVSRTAILDAGTELSLSRTRIFELVARYRADPVTSSLLDRAPGFPKGQHRLDPERDQIITAEIEGYYLTRPKPTIAQLTRRIGDVCYEHNLRRPARKTISSECWHLPNRRR